MPDIIAIGIVRLVFFADIEFTLSVKLLDRVFIFGICLLNLAMRNQYLAFRRPRSYYLHKIPHPNARN